MIRSAAFVACLLAFPGAGLAHQLVVFASVDCETLTVEAKFANGKVAKQGDVRVLDGDNALLTTLPLEENGTAQLPLSSVDHSGGLVVEVDTGGHDDFWIITPEDIARNCGS
ncbi:MAG: hypothetical protein AAFY73_07695 [Pseudomonadota bacterium]